jgi:hypothetical protein
VKKPKAIRETKNMIQTALWLPRGMHHLLKQAGGERGLGDEIRRRLQLTFGTGQQRRDRRDERTNLLLNLIEQLDISLDEPWSANRFARDVFKAAISELLDLIANVHPLSEPQPATMTKLQAKYGPDENPETIGRMLARSVLVENANQQLRREFADNQKE